MAEDSKHQAHPHRAIVWRVAWNVGGMMHTAPCGAV
jgi:hypothetical protein